MKKKGKFLGIIALAAIITITAALSMTGCPGPDPTDETAKDLTGDITISPSSGFTGTKLIATYTGSETVIYSWKRGETPIGSNTDNYTANDPGSYKVTVSAEGYNSKTSEPVEIIALYNFTAAPTLELAEDNQKIIYTWTASNPAADSYDVYWKEGKNLTAAQVKTGTKITGATSGGEITGLTNGTEYSVVVTANKANYTSIDSAIETETPVALSYIITGSGTTFTAKNKKDETIGTADQPIQTVIDAIKNNANGVECNIQFGDGTNALDIGTNTASFSGTGWAEEVILSGKITGANTSNTGGTIAIADAVSVTSRADITNTATNTNARAIYFNSTGTLAIEGGTVKAQAASGTTHGQAINIANTGLVTVSNEGTLITSTGTSSSGGTIVLSNAGARLSVTGGTVSNTAANTSAYAIRNASSTSNDAIKISGGTVSANTGQAINIANSGLVTVSGTASITSANVTSTAGTIVLSNTNAKLEIKGGTVTNTASSARVIYNASSSSANAITISGGTVSATQSSTHAVYNNVDGTVTVSGGTVSATTSGYAVYNYSTGTVTISGGTVSATTSYAVANYTTGAITISGGTVSATTGYTVYNYSTGTVTISGGTVSATTGRAVYNNSTGKITVSQPTATPTLVTSANTTNMQGTIFLAVPTTDNTNPRLEISGGTVENTASGNAVYSNSTGTITLNGNPTITGTMNIRTSTVSVGSSFAPAGKTYTLDFIALSTDIAVKGGANYLSNFSLKTTVFSGITVKLIAKDGNLAIEATNSDGYTVTGSGPYVITSPGLLPSVQTAIESIKAQTGGAACTIQFGNSTTALDIGGGTVALITFDSGWTGLVTLTGKLTSSSTTSAGIIRISGSASVNSKADLTATSSGYMIYKEGTGTLEISDGTVLAATDSAVYNSGGTLNVTGGIVQASVTSSSSGTVYIYNGSTVNISGGTVTTTSQGNAVFIYKGDINISNGTVSSTGSGNAVYNSDSQNTLTMTGGTITASSRTAVYNTGTVNISGGTISTGYYPALEHYSTSRKVTISGSAKLTSANTSTSTGTILLSSPYGVTSNVRLDIQGGTIENTSTAANGNAIYNGSVSGITMSAGAVSTTATSGRAILNNSTGALTVTGGTITAPVNSTAYAIYNASTGTVSVSGATVTGQKYGY